MIKAVIFDCFGVLTNDPWKEFVATLAEDQKQPARDLNHAYDAGFITEAEFITKVQAVTGKNPGEVEAVLVSETNKNKELLDYIKILKPKYKIGLLSNIASNWIRDTFLTPEEQALFDKIILSYEERMTKPDPRIFQAACGRLGVKPQEAIMVDDIKHYCAAARVLGMQAIVYEDFPQMKRELEAILAQG